MGMIGLDAPKATAPTIDSIKMPPLHRPPWIEEAVEIVKTSKAPLVGPQVTCLQQAMGHTTQ